VTFGDPAVFYPIALNSKLKARKMPGLLVSGGVVFMSDGNPKLKQALEGIDESKRATLTRLITGTSFAVPIVASFAMSGLTIDKAAAVPNGSVVPSDRRLKMDVVRVATLPSGLGLYRFKYLWGGIEYVGVLAQEVLEIAPHAVSVGKNGFLSVDYKALDCEMMSYADWAVQQQARPHNLAA